ncbi:hypothetical protein ANCDUO_19196 [Ancylostoma duodenale]|uniref:Nuclease HARBI1 n=1 Tax=Ancylostoma duodenale TaxID=51022 RepID=A0A0C2CLQ8_9BILA|nr:hypothetical protein ANCDUO_19196 [Ancylostoma duodenale]
MYLIEREILEEVLDLIDPPQCAFVVRRCPLNTLSDIEFLRRFRFTRHGFYKLVGMIAEDLAPMTLRSCPLTSSQQLAVFTSTLGCNEHQSVVANSFSCSQATVSRVMRNVSDWFATNARRFIAWPKKQESKEIGERIFEATGLRDVVGAIDGCLVRIRVPISDQLSYMDRYRCMNSGKIPGRLVADEEYGDEEFLLKPVGGDYLTESVL